MGLGCRSWLSACRFLGAACLMQDGAGLAQGTLVEIT